MTTQLTDPEHIAVSKSRGIDIDWKDGHHSFYPVEYLRDWCPCATCTGSHGTEPRKKTYAKRRPIRFRCISRASHGQHRAIRQLRPAHRLE